MIVEHLEQSSSDSRHELKSSGSRDTSVESSVQDSRKSRQWAAGEGNPKLGFNDASIRAAFLIVNVILVMPVLFIEQLRMFIVRRRWIQSVALIRD
ncbi:hypothetical protein GCK32_016262 [Trichostrongylus colubriformis]|uniref:Uncharacterized protein n=1 Tax=Trichostrongylus colubriformis TaxID=6319 RepID=A0AAN8IKQ5_TRICO